MSVGAAGAGGTPKTSSGLACLVLEAVLFAGLPFQGVEVPQPMLLVLVLALWGLVLFAGRATWYALQLVVLGSKGLLGLA